MNEPDILYPAIFVFSMLLIGLLLTVWEFYRIKKQQIPHASKQDTATGLEPGVAESPVRKVSSLQT